MLSKSSLVKKILLPGPVVPEVFKVTILFTSSWETDKNPKGVVHYIMHCGKWKLLKILDTVDMFTFKFCQLPAIKRAAGFSIGYGFL